VRKYDLAANGADLDDGRVYAPHRATFLHRIQLGAGREAGDWVLICRSCTSGFSGRALPRTASSSSCIRHRRSVRHPRVASVAPAGLRNVCPVEGACRTSAKTRQRPQCSGGVQKYAADRASPKGASQDVRVGRGVREDVLVQALWRTDRSRGPRSPDLRRLQAGERASKGRAEARETSRRELILTRIAG